MLVETLPVTELKQQGFTVLQKVLDVKQDIHPVIEECGSILNWLINRLYKEQKIVHNYLDLPIPDRFSAFFADTGDKYFQYFSLLLPVNDYPDDTPLYLGPAMFRLMRSPRLLDALEVFIGPEIAVNPLQITRIKPPQQKLPEDIQNHPNGMLSQTNWHQDLWAFENEANDTNVLTVWIPITRSTVENGCLEIVPGSHLSGGLTVHCGPNVDRPAFKGIPDELITGNTVSAVCEPGDIIILDKLTQHHSLINVSSEVRWSFDLRYQPIDQPVGQCGRPIWVARSRSHPSSEMTDPLEWKKLWREVISRESKNGITAWTRYSLGHPLCF